MDRTIKIGGEAGQGIQTIGDALGKVFARSGYHVFTNQDYESRIRGGHNTYQIRLSDMPAAAPLKSVDVLVAFDRESISMHRQEVRPDGIILYDPELLKGSFEGPEFLEVPFVRLASETGAGRVAANTAATGAILGILGFPLDPLFGILKDLLKKKDDRTREQNRLSAMAGYEYAQKNCTRCSFDLPAGGEPRMLLGGSEAIGLGALAGGLSFYSAYPMTPSTGIMLFLSAKAAQYGIIVEQAEDEIAAVNMALGASFAGVRSMTGTSGGGFALMTEGLSLAAMTETPVVIALAQRPAPATGLPTKTEQADLFFALHAGHGEFPRFIFAPGDPEEAFRLTVKAFDLSQKYQVPALILSDQYLADSQWTHDGLPLDGLPQKDYRVRADGIDSLETYARHAFTATGISPFAVPGKTRHVVVTDSDEHTEGGHITEDAGLRTRMVEKRLFLKLDAMRLEMAPPALYGPEDAETVLLCWGSTVGVVREAARALADRKVSVLHFSEIWPFPGTDAFDYLAVLKKAKRTIAIEMNATGQFARLVKNETGFAVSDRVLRYDGRPYMLEELVEELRGRT